MEEPGLAVTLKLATVALTECQALCWELSICCVWVPWLLFTCSHEEMRGVSTFRTQQNRGIWPQVPCQVLTLEWWSGPTVWAVPVGWTHMKWKCRKGGTRISFRLSLRLNAHFKSSPYIPMAEGHPVFPQLWSKAQQANKSDLCKTGKITTGSHSKGPSPGLPSCRTGQRHDSCWWGRLLQRLPSLLPSLLCLPSPSLYCTLFPFPLPSSFLSLGLMLIKPHWETKP